MLPKLPLTLDARRAAARRARRTPPRDHAPVLIQPNPLAAGRYVVLNSGHTFHEKELASLNYLLFPRLGDWAVLKVGDRRTRPIRWRRKCCAPASSTRRGYCRDHPR